MLNDIVADKRKKLYQVTEEQRKKLIENQSAQYGKDSLDESLSDDEFMDSSFGDDTVIPDEDKTLDHFAVIERDIRRAFEFYLELEEERRKIRSLQDSEKKYASITESRMPAKSGRNRQESSGKKSIFEVCLTLG